MAFAEDTCDDGAVPWNAAQQFAEQAVEDPDGTDQDLCCEPRHESAGLPVGM